jgi:hypothetical protein
VNRSAHESSEDGSTVPSIVTVNRDGLRFLSIAPP